MNEKDEEEDDGVKTAKTAEASMKKIMSSVTSCQMDMQMEMVDGDLKCQGLYHQGSKNIC